MKTMSMFAASLASLLADEHVDGGDPLTVMAHLSVGHERETGRGKDDPDQRMRRISDGEADEDDHDQQRIIQDSVRPRRVDRFLELADLLLDFTDPVVRFVVLHLGRQ